MATRYEPGATRSDAELWREAYDNEPEVTAFDWWEIEYKQFCEEQEDGNE